MNRETLVPARDLLFPCRRWNTGETNVTSPWRTRWHRFSFIPPPPVPVKGSVSCILPSALTILSLTGVWVGKIFARVDGLH